MKDRVVRVLIVLLISASFKLYSAQIEFPKTLGERDCEKYQLQYVKPVTAQKDSLIAQAIIKGKYFINGHLVQDKSENGIFRFNGFEAEVDFNPEISVEELHEFLNSTSLINVTNKEGYYTASYKGRLANGSIKFFDATTNINEVIYACPLPSSLTVERCTKTPFVQVTSQPVGHGLSIRDKALYQTTLQVHKEAIHYFDGSKTHVGIAPVPGKTVTSYTHSTLNNAPFSLSKELIKYVTYGKVLQNDTPQVMTDPTVFQRPLPLRYYINHDSKGNPHLYTYTYKALCGDKTLTSSAFKINNSQLFVSIPLYHMGPQVEFNHAPHDQYGNCVVPNLYATQFAQEDDKTITMKCIYAPADNVEQALVLTTSLEVPATQCHVYGKNAYSTKEYVGTSLASKYNSINKDVTIKHTQAEPAVALHVVPPLR